MSVDEPDHDDSEFELDWPDCPEWAHASEPITDEPVDSDEAPVVVEEDSSAVEVELAELPPQSLRLSPLLRRRTRRRCSGGITLPPPRRLLSWAFSKARVPARWIASTAGSGLAIALRRNGR